jgi:hypothetical protein
MYTEFRDFQLFNKHVDEQGWTVLTNLNSLCIKVLKGKYYFLRSILSFTNTDSYLRKVI